jgi:hypothetical protein
MAKFRICFLGLAVFSLEASALAAAPGESRETSPPKHAKGAAAQEEAAPTEEAAPLPEGGGFAVGARAGYALPMGSVAKDQLLGGANDLSKYASGMAPLIVDVGYRINRRVYVGGYFQFAFLSTSGDLCGGATGCSSSGNDLRFGGMVRYNFTPAARFDPWIGGGVGYEIMNLSVTSGVKATNSTVRGFEFANVQIGGDFHVLPDLAIGPLVMLSVGQFGTYDVAHATGSSTSGDFSQTGLHQWLMFGARAEYTP